MNKNGNHFQPPAWLFPTSFVFSVATKHRQTVWDFLMVVAMLLNHGVRILLVVLLARLTGRTGCTPSGHPASCCPNHGRCLAPAASNLPGWLQMQVSLWSRGKCCPQKVTCSSMLFPSGHLFLIFFPTYAKWGLFLSSIQSLVPSVPLVKAEFQGELVMPLLRW